MIRTPTSPGSRRQWWPGLALAALFLALTLPVILSGRGGVSEEDDQRMYHLPVILTMVDQWPRIDLVHYRSATSPGYHLLMAGACRYVSDNLTFLRLLSSLFGLALVLIVFSRARLGVNGSAAFVLALPLLFSPYVLGGSIWLTTDNAAWACVALALGGAAFLQLTTDRVSRWCLYSTLAVFIRQIHIWLAAPLALATMLCEQPKQSLSSSSDRPHEGASGHVLNLHWPHRSLLLLAFPWALLVTFVVFWRGLMPPAYVSIHNRGANFAAIPVMLALCGLFGFFLLPAFGRVNWRELTHARALWIFASLAAAASVIVPTSWDYDAGRGGGPIWRLVKLLPDVAHRSVLFPPLSILGCIVLFAAWRACKAAQQSRSAAVLLMGLAAFLGAQCMNSQAWQRYFEPIVLITLAWLAALARTRPSPERSPARDTEPSESIVWLAGPALLALAQLVFSIVSLYWPVLSQGAAE